MILRCQPSPARWRGVEAPTSRFDSQGCPVHQHLRPRAEEAGRILSTRLLQLAEVDVLHSAKNGIWYQVSETPIGGRRVTRVVSQAARGALEHASAAPLSSTLCALPVQAIDDAQGQVRSRRTQVRRTFAYQCVPNHVNPFDPIGSGEIFDEVDDSLLETGNRSHKDRS